MSFDSDLFFVEREAPGDPYAAVRTQDGRAYDDLLQAVVTHLVGTPRLPGSRA